MRWIFPGFFAVLAAGSAYLFVTRYWLYRECIAAALSSCITPEGDNLTSGGMIWGGFALLFLAITLLSASGQNKSRSQK